ncbi:MAG: hypothetical protein GZ094_15885 [Mariniphaga sp.]|nr:hypothetical protein [Mariniphaga sp.]
MKNYLFVFLLLNIFFSSRSIDAQNSNSLPTIEKKTGFSHLMVNGKPWIMLSGELHNSSASDLQYMSPIWDKLVDMHLNTVIATVSWELFEPVEGKYDYTLVDGIIKGAREHQLKLVLIWFGTWKNTWSTYAPEWVKTDLKRFPRMQTKPGENSGALSAFGGKTCIADARAFTELMKHIGEIDSKDQTVLMMQVENETGVLNTSRDRSDLAETEFIKPIPVELSNFLKVNSTSLMPEMKAVLSSTGELKGNWQDVFGASADEMFQAWFTAKYVGQVCSAGKAAYNIPMYVNAWLDPSFAESPKTEYPSGGPVSRVLDVWKAAAPSIDLFAPDIYLDDFKRVCKIYHQAGNPLFIPEAQRDARAAANVYYALGQHNAICFAPFGIDGVKDIQSIVKVYGSLEGFLPFFAQKQGSKNNVGLLYSGDKTELIELGGYKIKITYNQQRDEEKKQPEAGGLILNTAPGEFYIAGFGFRAVFETLDQKGWVEFLSHDEVVFEKGICKPLRRMNGDEMEVNIGSAPSIQKVRVQTIK